MSKHVVIFEARGGSDKGPYGYRRDSMPIVTALKERGWTAEIIFFIKMKYAEKSSSTLSNMQQPTSAV